MEQRFIMRRAWSDSGSSGCQQPISGSTTTTTRSTTASGTTVSSTTYTPPSVDPSLLGWGRHDKEAVTMELMRCLLAEEFCGGGADGSAAAVTASDRWLLEMDVAWLLRLAELHASGSARGLFISQLKLQRIVQRWIVALQVITKSIVWVCSSSSGKEETTPAAPPEFVRFVKATLSKMLNFVDAIIVAPLNVGDPVSTSSSVVGAAEKLLALLQMRGALSTASEQMVMQQSSTRRITDHLGGLLSAEVQLFKLDQAVCNTLGHIRATVMSYLYNYSSWGIIQMTLQSSPDIHKVSRSVINSIKVLSTNWWYMDDIISKAMRPADYALQFGRRMCCLSTLMMELAHVLEQELARVSQSFPDQSLKFIFLINNSYFMGQELKVIWTLRNGLTDNLHTSFLNNLTRKIETYINSYLQVSWEPVLNCLHKRTPHCFSRNQPLQKFESKFLATYAAQKLWKVPDPDMRRRLRDAISKKVVSGYRKYLEDNNRITPEVTSQEVEEMLQELFES